VGTIRNVCPDCGSTQTSEQPVVEHGRCGCIRERSAFDDGCQKCGVTAIKDELEAVGTVQLCASCGARWRPTAEDPVSTESAGDQPTRSIDLTAYRRQSAEHSRWRKWVSERLGSQSAAVVFLLMVVAVGLGGATVSTSLLAEETAGSVAGPDDREWTAYESIVVFRNDDIQPWYRTETRRAVDRLFIEENVPVTLGVIPAVEGTGSPITDSDGTCDYLRSLLSDHPGQFEIALHGYTHDRRTGFYTGSEFGGVDNATQAQWLSTGTGIMTACTGVEPRTFIPPMNTYDTGTVRAANAEGYRTISGGNWFTAQYYNETGVFVAGGLIHVSQDASFVDWDRHGLYNQSALRNEFDEAYEANELHVQMLHYRNFETEADRAKLRRLIRYMKSTDTAFLTVDQLATGLETGEIRQTGDGWEIREPLSTGPDAPDRIDDSRGRPPLFEIGGR